MEIFKNAQAALNSACFTDSEKQKLNTLLSLLKDMNINEQIQLAGVVYFCVLHKKMDIAEVKTNYSAEIYNIITVLDRIEKLNYSQQATEAENIRRMFFAITKDIRIIMLKLAFVVMNLRNINELEKSQAENYASAILVLFAPLAARLGLTTYKTELENGAFYILNTETYNTIQREVDERFHKRQPIVERLKKLVQDCMDELKIKGRVSGRKKHIYSIYKKLQDHSLDNSYDLVAVRAIVETVADCYALLGRLSAILEPIPNRFKDYIATPKPNGYQSLHTTVKFESYPVEIQIRTEEMNKYAEYGIAAHWIYKEKRAKQDDLDVRLAWFRQMLDNDSVDIDELAGSLSQDIYNGEIFVQTPMGKVIYLPSQSTPIDFAYAIHSQVGNTCVGAKVNGKMVPVNYQLNNGDVVQIITNPNSKGPSRDWLKICKTSSAKSKINAFFKKNIKEETIRLGKTMLETAIKDKGYAVSKLLTKQVVDDILKYYNMTDIDEFYANIGTNAISANYTTNKLVAAYQKQQKVEQTDVKAVVNFSTPNDNMVKLQGLNNILIKFAGCCKPMYGDDIIGFVSAGRGVIVHRKICPNLSYFSASRLIEASWKPIKEPTKKKTQKQKTTVKPEKT